MVQVSDTTMAAAEYALEGLRLRADVRAHNVANLNTPGFVARQVDFEQQLAGALESGDAATVPPPATSYAPNLPDAQGNTTSLEGEMVGMLKDNLLRDAMVNAFNFKANLLRTAIGR